MQAEDEEAMLAFARQLPEHDLLFLPVDITRPKTVRTWIKNIERKRNTTVLAKEGGRLVGYCSLHRGDLLWIRHLGEIRLLVSSNYRGKGIGGALARQVFAIAQATDLHKLMVQMMSTQRDAQALFHRLGFIPEALLNEWVIDRNGRMHDLIVMSREVDDVVEPPQK
jgi:RimJ/RimL family protein N-acetyltransferase